MALRDEVDPHVPGPKCTVVKQMEAHPDLAAEIEECLRDRSLPNAALARAFRKHNIDISINTISRHRNNDCGTCRRARVIW